MPDVGTGRQSLPGDPLYIGNRHPRVPAAEYGAFLGEFVRAAGKLFPLALLHWEDLGVADARRLLERYRDERLTFSDDIQGTGAVNLAAVLAATRATGAGAFTEAVVRDMAGHTERPVILPVSNPAVLSEAAPADLLRWTGGRALVAAGTRLVPAATKASATRSARPATL